MNSFLKRFISFKFAKKAVICIMICIVLCCFAMDSFFAFEGGFNIIAELPEALLWLFGNIFGVHLYVDESVIAVMMIIVAVVKIGDYIYTITNFPTDENPERELSVGHKIFNVLGIILLPLWTLLAGFVFYLFGSVIVNQFNFADLVFGIGVVHKLVSAVIMFILFVLPTLCIFVCSLVLDIAGLRAKKR